MHLKADVTIRHFRNLLLLVRSPVLRTRSYVLRMFLFHLLTHFLRRPSFCKFFHMTWLQTQKKRCYADFLKVPSNKNEGQKTNFAQPKSLQCQLLLKSS